MVLLATAPKSILNLRHRTYDAQSGPQIAAREEGELKKSPAGASVLLCNEDHPSPRAQKRTKSRNLLDYGARARGVVWVFIVAFAFATCISILLILFCFL